jgi:hypothetical protein
MRSWINICLAFVLAVSACSEEEQPVDSRARVHFNQDSLVSYQWVNVILDDGKTVWNFGPEDFMRSPLDASLFTTPDVQTQANGNLQMTFRLIPQADSLFSDGTITAVMSPNWKWSFELVLSTTEPPLACDDCWKVSDFTIYDPAYADKRIYVLWRGGGP